MEDQYKIVQFHLDSLTSSGKNSCQSIPSACGWSFCGSQTPSRVLVLVVKIDGREEGFGHSLLRFLPGLDVPAPLGCSKGGKIRNELHGHSAEHTQQALGRQSCCTGGTGAGWEQPPSEQDG